MRKVLIITYSFPPINNVTASQYGEIAFQMPRFGWQPFVLTTKSQGSLPVKIPENNIIRIGEHCHSNKILVAKEGYRGIPKLVKPLYFLYKKQGIDIRSIDRFLFSWGREALKCIEAIKEINPDAIIAATTPIASFWLGRIFSKRIEKPWLADLRDPCSLWNTSKVPGIKFLDKEIDRFLLKNAAAIVTVGPYLASVMEDFYKKPVEVIFNGFDKTGTMAFQKKAPKKGKKKIIYYAGTFYPHRLPAVRLLIDWLAGNKKNNSSLLIRSKGPAELNRKVLDYAREKKVPHKVNLLNPALPEKINQEQEKADILILFEDLTKSFPFSQGSMTGKLFEYLPFQAPIIVIAREDSDMGIILKDTSRGYLVSDLDSLDTAINDISKGSSLNPNWLKVKNYSRESQSEILCNLLNQIV